MSTSGRVMVLDGSLRQSLSVTRALGRRGLHVEVGDSVGLTVTTSSKYCAAKHVYPDPAKRPDEFMAYLLDLLEKGDFDLVIPNSDRTVKLLALNKEALSDYTAVPLPRAEVVLGIIDKQRLMDEADRIGVPHPTTYSLGSGAGIDDSIAAAQYPLVIKPRTCSGAIGLKICNSAESFEADYQQVNACFPRPVVQEFIPPGGGKFTYGGIIDENGNEKAGFVHEYLRLYPAKGGVGTLARSARNDRVWECGREILQTLGWYGVAEVEFMIDPRDGLPKLLEINPRFWGMVEVAVRAGMDLPFHLYAMAVHGDHQRYDEYAVDRFVRWLLPGDILHFVTNWKNIPKRRSFFANENADTHYYILSRDDYMPAVMSPLWTIRSLMQKDIRRLVFRRY